MCTEIKPESNPGDTKRFSFLHGAVDPLQAFRIVHSVSHSISSHVCDFVSENETESVKQQFG